MQKTSVESAK